MSAAPAASQRRAVSTSSSSVVGSWGRSALVCSAPVGATVMRVPRGAAADGVVMAAIMPPGPAARRPAAAGPEDRARTLSGRDDDRLRGGEVVGDKVGVSAMLRLTTASAIGPSSWWRATVVSRPTGRSPSDAPRRPASGST